MTREVRMHPLFRLFALLTLAAAAFLAGCASQRPMALADGQAPKQDKVTVLMKVTVGNDYKPRYQPNLLFATYAKAVVKEQADRFVFKPDSVSTLPLKDDTDEPQHNVYLLSMELDPGQYVFEGMVSQGRGFPFIGTFHTPYAQKVEYGKAGVFYAGHLHAVVRERKDDEPRAGSVIPLIDQAATGASGGTFDVTLTDDWDADSKVFNTLYPALAKVNVEKQLLPPYDRKAAYPE